MLLKIVGVQPQDYTMDNGYSFKGNKIHVIDMETKVEGMLGNQVSDFKIPISSPLYAMPLSIGSVYRCYFDKKGRPEEIRLADQPAADQFNFMDESELTKPSKK